MRRCGVWQTLFYILCLEKNAGEIPRFKFLGVLPVKSGRKKNLRYIQNDFPTITRRLLRTDENAA